MRVGSLFSGYGGLDLAVGGELAWFSDVEPAAVTVMQAHNPGVPNLGDIKLVDWKSVEPVDVLTGGYPCQPFSTAGQRKGVEDERHLWPYVRDAIGVLEPGVAVLENVAGHLSLGLGTVVGELSEVGYSARWGVVQASDTGAPHRRARVFIVAYPTSAEWGDTKSKYLVAGERSAEPRERISVFANPEGCGRGEGSGHATAQTGSGYERIGYPPRSPVADTNRKPNGYVAGRGIASGTQFQPDPKRITGCDIESDASVGVSENQEPIAFGPYEQAIRRWEQVLGRTAPTPIVSRKGRDKLNPVFVEWMMGLPEGWVTGHGLTASQELKLLGNGVVPQQARLALELL